MPSQKKIIIGFDLYGTLLSTESIAETLGEIYGREKAAPLAALWRRYQLEYTWRMTAMGKYKPFSQITRAALSHAVTELLDDDNDDSLGQQQLRDEDADTLMRAYDSLHVFPEIPRALEMLREHGGDGDKKEKEDENGNEKEKETEEKQRETDKAKGHERNKTIVIEAYVFSNGTEEMISTSIRTSPELGPHASVFRSLVTVDGLRCYKPHPKTYEHLVEQAGKNNNNSSSSSSGGSKGSDGDGGRVSKEDIWVVSANPFDIAGARAFGLKAAFIDRLGKGWIDRIDETRVPSVIARGVDEAVRAIISGYSDQ